MNWLIVCLCLCVFGVKFNGFFLVKKKKFELIILIGSVYDEYFFKELIKFELFLSTKFIKYKCRLTFMNYMQ